MDKYLLTLWKNVPSGEIKKEHLAEILSISSKQATRYIQKWAEEGWFTYVAGRGRGNASTLKWLINVEEIFEQEVIQIIDSEAVETSSKYLMYDWSSASKQRLLERFRLKFGFSQEKGVIDKLIIPRRYKFLTMHPLEIADVHSANFVATVFNRLVSVASDGQISPELAHSWDNSSTKLRLYLKKGVKFHDGSSLSADDVVNCLNRVRSQQNFKDLWEPVQNISAPFPLVVDFDFPGGCSYCLQMLGMMTSSIFKENNGQLHGTGSFYLDDKHKFKTVLAAFNDYFGERPLLDVIEFVQVPQDFDVAYRSDRSCSEEKTFMVESDSGVGMVFLNKFRNSPIQRREVRDFIHWAIAEHRDSIVKADCRIWPNSEGMLVGRSVHYNVPEAERPDFENPIIMKTTEYLMEISNWLKNVLEAEGIPVEVHLLPFREYINDNGADQEADIYIHGEIFEMNQDFSFYYFLKNGLSPLSPLIKSDAKLSSLLGKYVRTPFEDWGTLHREFENYLLTSSVMVPLYYAKRQIPFSSELKNIEFSHFGYVDFSKLWVRPEM